jgi:lipoprotein-anchoring transpeptidase ErfK/SrfK
VLGLAVSAGCLRARNSDMRWLMRRVRLGTRVDIHA